MNPSGSTPTWQDETRTILGLSVPLTAAFVAEMGLVITDMIIVGRLGSNELAAVGLAGDWFWVLLLIGMGVISIIGVIAAQNLGAGNLKGVTEASDQGMIAAAITSIPVMLSVWYLGPVLGPFCSSWLDNCRGPWAECRTQLHAGLWQVRVSGHGCCRCCVRHNHC